MRAVLLSLVCAAGLLAATPVTTTAAAGPAATAISAPAAPVVIALQQADKTIDININGGGRWYRSPVWIAIGAIAVVVILLLLIIAVRGSGSGTTIIKD